MKIIILLFVGMSLLISTHSHADGEYVVAHGKIVSIYSTASNIDRFAIQILGGTGVCAGQKVYFPRSASDYSEVHKRAYSTALTAFLTGVDVSIYNYHAGDCLTASLIRLEK